VLSSLDDAQADYVRAVREIQIADRERYAEAFRDYQASIQEAQQEYQQRTTDAANAYTESQSAEAGSDPSPPDDPTAELQRAWADAQDRIAEANRAYRDVGVKLWERSADAYREAFRDYVRALQAGLGGVDAAEVSPQSLLRAAQGIHLTAMSAAATPAATPRGSVASAAKGASAKK
jgi:hypothetical protein